MGSLPINYRLVAVIWRARHGITLLPTDPCLEKAIRRTGAKGSGKFERITWDAALAEIGTRWKSIIAESGPTAILPYSYLGTEGCLNGLNAGDPFFNKLGATISERTFCDSGACTGYIMTVGPTVGLDPESFRHSKYIIIWAANPVSTNSHH